MERPKNIKEARWRTIYSALNNSLNFSVAASLHGLIVATDCTNLHGLKKDRSMQAALQCHRGKGSSCFVIAVGKLQRLICCPVVATLMTSQFASGNDKKSAH